MKKEEEILPLATTHIAISHLCYQFNDAFTPLISMPHFESFNLYQNKPKIKLFLQKDKIFSSARSFAPRP